VSEKNYIGEYFAMLQEERGCLVHSSSFSSEAARRTRCVQDVYSTMINFLAEFKKKINSDELKIRLIFGLAVFCRDL